MRLQRGEFLRSIGRGDVARQIETPRNRAPITIEQQLDAVELEVELAVNADARRVWKAGRSYDSLRGSRSGNLAKAQWCLGTPSPSAS